MPAGPGWGSVPMVLTTTLIWGCQSGQQSTDPQALRPFAEEAAGVFAVDETAQDGGVVEPTWWSVLVAAVPSGRMDDAERILETVRAAGLPGAYIAVRDKRPVIAFGRYDDPAQPEAQAGLQTVRQAQIGGVTPFGAAMLMPPGVVVGDAGNVMDLRTVRARLGDSARYTLQIGAYGRGDLQRPTQEELALFRREAERAAAQLRGGGEDAYFYHGPNRSSVTIGVFGEDDLDATTTPPIESPRLRDLRKRYPNNLLNGEGIMETVQTERGPHKRLQATRLVAIPDK